MEHMQSGGDIWMVTMSWGLQIIAFGNPEVTTGGMALGFYASVRMRIGRIKSGGLLDSDGNETGIHVKVKVRALPQRCFQAGDTNALHSDGLGGTGRVDSSPRLQMSRSKYVV